MLSLRLLGNIFDLEILFGECSGTFRANQCLMWFNPSSPPPGLVSAVSVAVEVLLVVGGDRTALCVARVQVTQIHRNQLHRGFIQGFYNP